MMVNNLDLELINECVLFANLTYSVNFKSELNNPSFSERYKLIWCWDVGSCFYLLKQLILLLIFCSPAVYFLFVTLYMLWFSILSGEFVC